MRGKSYVGETGKSMKVVDLALSPNVLSKNRNIGHNPVLSVNCYRFARHTPQIGVKPPTGLSTFHKAPSGPR
jgi:hypothetical protein